MATKRALSKSVAEASKTKEVGYLVLTDFYDLKRNSKLYRANTVYPVQDASAERLEELVEKGVLKRMEV